MKVRVKLYGTFSRRFPEDCSSTGMEMEIPLGSSAKDLLAHLQIREDQGGVVVLNGRILKMVDEIPRRWRSGSSRAFTGVDDLGPGTG